MYSQNRRCRCVGPTLIDRCVAIRQFVRPEDVAHLIRRRQRTPLDWNHSRAGSLSNWFQNQFALGKLRYISDPPDCDRWGRPSHTLERGGGDCDDLAILAASFCRAMNVPMALVVGRVCNRRTCEGHAWVEGQDEHGWFLLEATNGSITRGLLPNDYRRELFLTPESCAIAPDASARHLQTARVTINRIVDRGMPRAFAYAS
jgi:Transglutaminase-like superfamily